MDSPDFGTDIQVKHHLNMGSSLEPVTVGGDLATVTGIDNLAQALWLRLGTPLGDLEHLGHPDFGSRLHLLTGRLINPATIALTKAYVREALRREPRIMRLPALEVAPDPTEPGTLIIYISVVPAGEYSQLELTLSLSLESRQAGVSNYAATGG